ncbi:hypothetical protein CCACVL1_09476 [Corchorus capsularis]|uniref:Uncharacterized protein n=1 Tax=Corchorus capsularis TaxID=210143 RepID=A0A1R3IW27_COCAP|nr:hypothetical protein CCACVL1_09476 [Corchorus capsularis]
MEKSNFLKGVVKSRKEIYRDSMI